MINYDTMEAGLEMDVLVAEKVMGWVRGYHEKDPNDPYEYWKCFYSDNKWDYITIGRVTNFRPSINYTAAMKVVEKLMETWRSVRVHVVQGEGKDAKWSVLISSQPWTSTGNMDGLDCLYGEAPTAPLAICRAALLAVEAKNSMGHKEAS